MSQRGGQTILTLRALRVGDQFDAGWIELAQANRDRLAIRGWGALVG